jgi:hypothetical protein
MMVRKLAQTKTAKGVASNNSPVVVPLQPEPRPPLTLAENDTNLQRATEAIPRPGAMTPQQPTR